MNTDWNEALDIQRNEEREYDREQKATQRYDHDDAPIKGIIETLNDDEYKEYLMAKGSTMKIRPMGYDEHEPTTFERAQYNEDVEQEIYERDDKLGAI